MLLIRLTAKVNCMLSEERSASYYLVMVNFVFVTAAFDTSVRKKRAFSKINNVGRAMDSFFFFFFCARKSLSCIS